MPILDIFNIFVRKTCRKRRTECYSFYALQPLRQMRVISEGASGFIRANQSKVLYQERCRLWLTRAILVGAGRVNGQIEVCKERWWFEEKQ